MKRQIERLDTTPEELETLVERARAALDEDGYQKLKAAIRTLGCLTTLLENQQTTLQSLRNLLCQAQTEKTADVLKRAGVNTEKTPATPKPKAPGHGRHGAKAYRGGHKVRVPHTALKAGDPCPGCERGKVYPQRDPGVLVRLIGRAPIEATVYELEKLRCNLCGEVFTAKAPDGIGDEKYDVTVGKYDRHTALRRWDSQCTGWKSWKTAWGFPCPLPSNRRSLARWLSRSDRSGTN